MRCKIVPEIRHFKRFSNILGLEGIKCIVSPCRFDDSSFRTACLLRDEMKNRFAIEKNVLIDAKPGKNTITVGLISNPMIRKALSGPLRSKAADSLGPEGYALSVSANRAVIGGVDAAGLFYGVQTFLQLAEKRSGGWRLGCGEVIDAPAHPMRGVHLYVPPKKEIPYFKRLIRFLASVKINTILLELGGALELKRHPEVNHAWTKFCHEACENYLGPTPGVRLFHPQSGCYGNSIHQEQGGGTWISQDDMREILACAAEHHVSIIPEVQSLSHSYWLCVPHPEIAERQGEPYPDSYCPSNPKSYELLFDCMDEVIDLMRPEWVMIGHDEWYHYCICPECKKKNAYDLLAADVGKIQEHLGKRGCKCMMWCEKLLHGAELENDRIDPVEGKVPYGGDKRIFVDEAGGKFVRKDTWQAMDKISNDILMIDWFWCLSPDTDRQFAEHGKTVVFGNFSPQHFDRNRRRLHGKHVRGGIFSSWFEASHMAQALTCWPYNAMLSAEMFWSADRKNRMLEKKTPMLNDFWSRQREILTDSVRRRPTMENRAWKAKPINLDTLKARPQSKLSALHWKKSLHPIPLTPAKKPLAIRIGEDPAVIPIERKVRGIAFLLQYMKGEKDLPPRPIYVFRNYAEYYFDREVGYCAAMVRHAPASPTRGALDGGFSLYLGGEVGQEAKGEFADGAFASSGAAAGFADRVFLPGGGAAYVYEWRNFNPGNIMIEEIAIKPGRSPLGGTLAIHAISLIL
jgi:hypothetical protein